MAKFSLPVRYLEEKLVAERTHPEFPWLKLYDYTQHCQFSKAWDDVTMMCRGLVVDSRTGDIVARPFRKFFNWEERKESVPAGTPTVWEKMDGSLGILYFVEGRPYVCTRGSFQSDQAKWATQYVRHHLPQSSWPVLAGSQVTDLFEIIYPENRIVVDYGKTEKMALLGAVDKETGVEFPPLHFTAGPAFEPARNFPFSSVEALKALDTKNEEGFVLVYPGGQKLKVKFDQYVALHKIYTGLNTNGVWEMLRDGKDPREACPDEMYGWLEETMKPILEKYRAIERDAAVAFTASRLQNGRKDQAAAIMTCPNKDAVPVAFKMLDGKPYADVIWKACKPKFSCKTFRCSSDS